MSYAENDRLKASRQWHDAIRKAKGNTEGSLDGNVFMSKVEQIRGTDIQYRYISIQNISWNGLEPGLYLETNLAEESLPEDPNDLPFGQIIVELSEVLSSQTPIGKRITAQLSESIAIDFGSTFVIAPAFTSNGAVVFEIAPVLLSEATSKTQQFLIGKRAGRIHSA